MNLNDEEYKQFKAMKKQSTVVDKILMVAVALFVIWLVCTLLASLAAA